MGCSPSQDSSHHQDEATIFRQPEIPKLNLHVSHGFRILGGQTRMIISPLVGFL